MAAQVAPRGNPIVARVSAKCGAPSEHQEGNHHADNHEGQGDAQHPANDAGCLALPCLRRSIFRWWLFGHANIWTHRLATRFLAVEALVLDVQSVNPA